MTLLAATLLSLITTVQPTAAQPAPEVTPDVVAGSATAAPIDRRLPIYGIAPGVAGSAKCVGSDTSVNLVTLWAQEFETFYPNVRVEVEGKGSSTAPPALISGTATFGPMSRALKPKEIDAFEKKFGYKPTELRTAIDALAVFVHKDCPLEEISFDQLIDVFSVAGSEMTWADIGVDDPDFARRPISLYGRNSASGTYGFFKQFALDNNDYKATVKEQPGSSAVVQSVAVDRFAMGYSGLGYKTAGVKALRVSIADGEEAFEPNAANANTGDYPLARFLNVALNYKPRAELEPMRREFIKMMFSREGQAVVLKEKFYPLSAEIARTELAKVGIDADF